MSKAPADVFKELEGLRKKLRVLRDEAKAASTNVNDLRGSYPKDSDRLDIASAILWELANIIEGAVEETETPMNILEAVAMKES